MIYKRQYLQYNDLVFEDVIMDDVSVSYKTFESDYGFGNGAYAPINARGPFLEAGRVSFSFTLHMKTLPCAHRPYYLRFAKGELNKPGKLWAIQDNTVIWAYAILESMVLVHTSRKNEQTIDVDFSIPEGVWHKADKLRTFLTPYDPCDFMECYDFKDIDPCECCDCEPDVDECDCCDCIEKDMALCYHKDEMQDFYDCDGPRYRFKYDCAKANEFFGGYDGIHFGQKMCSDCDSPIQGYLYSDTDINTDGVKITLHGEMKNPYIEINGNGNIIEGEYDGSLIVYSDGSVYFQKDWDCPMCDPLPVSSWIIPENMEYGWVIHPGKNKILIDHGSCCMTCAYIEVDALAI